MVLRKVVFVRHGESQGNAENVYTGWADTPLSVRGEQEATEAGLCIKASGLKFDICFSSVLPRATKTMEFVCNMSNNDSAPVVTNYRLNARHSGGLQGLTQAQAVAVYGENKVTLWRSSYDVLPACVDTSDPRHPVNDPVYANVPREKLPGGESLAHVVDRVVPYWREDIVPRIHAGDSVLIVGHKNSFRALWKYIERIPDSDALDSKLPPASAPLIYEFEEEEGEEDGKFIFAGLVFKKKYVMNFPIVNPKVPQGAKVLGKAYCLRHGESVNNARGADNGWENTALTLKGEKQAIEAGMCLKDKGIKVDMIFTSCLQRAVKTAELCCMTSNNAFAVPVRTSWRLNARHSGQLHGISGENAIELYGPSAAAFRTSDGAPPASLDQEDPRHPVHDPLYAGVKPELLPCGESYDQMATRVLPYWESDIMPEIIAGRSVLIVAHRNPLKAILEHVNDASEKGSFDFQVRSTLPFVVEFVKGEADGRPTVLTKYSLSSFAPQLSLSVRTVGKVVFLRHGESECNVTGAFTGWEDSGLTPKGEKEAVDAGRQLGQGGYKFDVVFTSVLSRAVESMQMICAESGNSSVPVVKSWRLNARHPGVLQGLTKAEAAKKYGKDKVDLWRGSFDVLPECVSLSDPRHPVNCPQYAHVPQEELPRGGESLENTLARVVPFWREQVVPHIQAGENILIVGHKNSMKALFMYLEDTPERGMFDVRPVSAQAPLVFEFGETGFSSGLVIVKKYWVNHTEEAALAKARCKDGSMHM